VLQCKYLPLHQAIADGDIARVQELLTVANVESLEQKYGSYTPLFRAVTLGYAEIVELLLINGANPNTQGCLV